MQEEHCFLNENRSDMIMITDGESYSGSDDDLDFGTLSLSFPRLNETMNIKYENIWYDL